MSDQICDHWKREAYMEQKRTIEDLKATARESEYAIKCEMEHRDHYRYERDQLKAKVIELKTIAEANWKTWLVGTETKDERDQLKARVKELDAFISKECVPKDLHDLIKKENDRFRKGLQKMAAIPCYCGNEHRPLFDGDPAKDYYQNIPRAHWCHSCIAAEVLS